MTDASRFEVISADEYSMRCSFCSRVVKRVVALRCPQQASRVVASDPELEDRFALSGQLGLCAYCVLEMAKTLAAAEGSP